MTDQTVDVGPVLVLGVLWDAEGHVGFDWEITVHGAANQEAALQACRDRSDTITDWQVVDRFESPPFSTARTINL